MSIATEITRIKNNISSAYDKLQEKGAILPTNKNSNNLTATIESISGGGGSGGGIGQYDIVQTNVDGGCELHIRDGGTSDKMYYCKAIDYDGRTLKDGWYYYGQEFELPAFPTHDKLIAQEWSATSPIVDNKIVVSSDIMAGVVYTTKDFTTNAKNEDRKFEIVISEEGEHTITAIDNSGKSITKTFTIDRTNPELNIIRAVGENPGICVSDKNPVTTVFKSDKNEILKGSLLSSFSVG